MYSTPFTPVTVTHCLKTTGAQQQDEQIGSPFPTHSVTKGTSPSRRTIAFQLLIAYQPLKAEDIKNVRLVCKEDAMETAKSPSFAKKFIVQLDASNFYLPMPPKSKFQPTDPQIIERCEETNKHKFEFIYKNNLKCNLAFYTVFKLELFYMYLLRAGDYFLFYKHLQPSDDYPELCKREDKVEFIRKTQTIESLEEDASTDAYVKYCDYYPIKKILSTLLEIISKDQKNFSNFKHLKSSIKLSDLLSDSLPSLSFIESLQLKTPD